MIEQIERQIEGALLGALKGAAVQALNYKVGQLVGGSSAGEALFITDFNDFLYQGPAKRTELYMNDFFTLTTRGKDLRSNYIGAGDSGGIGGNYTSYLEIVGKQATTEAGGVSTTIWKNIRRIRRRCSRRATSGHSMRSFPTQPIIRTGILCRRNKCIRIRWHGSNRRAWSKRSHRRI